MTILGARSATVTALIAALLATGCVEPRLAPDDAAPPAAIPDPSTTVPPADDAVRERATTLAQHLDRLHSVLDDATSATDLASARSAGDAAHALLLIGTSAAPPLLPADVPDRATTPDNPAVLLTVLAEARAVSSTFATEVEAIVADQFAGDLGAWQRDPPGMVGLATDTAASTNDLGALETAILALPGDATRTLAWVEVVRSADDLSIAHGAAERAQTHVELVLAALAELGLDPETA